MSLKTATQAVAAVAAGLVGGKAEAANLNTPLTPPAAVARFDPSAPLTGATFSSRDALLSLTVPNIQEPQGPPPPPPAVGGSVQGPGAATKPAAAPTQAPAPKPAAAVEPVTLADLVARTNKAMDLMNIAATEAGRRFDSGGKTTQLGVEVVSALFNGATVRDPADGQQKQVRFSDIVQGLAEQKAQIDIWKGLLKALETNPEIQKEMAKWPLADLDGVLALFDKTDQLAAPGRARGATAQQKVEAIRLATQGLLGRVEDKLAVQITAAAGVAEKQQAFEAAIGTPGVNNPRLAAFLAVLKFARPGAMTQSDRYSAGMLGKVTAMLEGLVEKYSPKTEAKK